MQTRAMAKENTKTTSSVHFQSGVGDLDKQFPAETGILSEAAYIDKAALGWPLSGPSVCGIQPQWLITPPFKGFGQETGTQ